MLRYCAITAHLCITVPVHTGPVYQSLLPFFADGYVEAPVSVTVLQTLAMQLQTIGKVLYI